MLDLIFAVIFFGIPIVVMFYVMRLIKGNSHDIDYDDAGNDEGHVSVASDEVHEAIETMLNLEPPPLSDYQKAARLEYRLLMGMAKQKPKPGPLNSHLKGQQALMSNYANLQATYNQSLMYSNMHAQRGMDMGNILGNLF